MKESADQEQQMSELKQIQHEINNVLTGIIGHTQLLLLRGQMDEKSCQRVEKIEELSHRIREIAARIAD